MSEAMGNFYCVYASGGRGEHRPKGENGAEKHNGKMPCRRMEMDAWV